MYSTTKKNIDSTKFNGDKHSRRALLGFTASLLAISSTQISSADLISELVEKSAANKEINNKKVLATSYANFARSRTVTDKTCSAPNNFLGCQNAAESGKVKFITDDLQVECVGKEGRCTSRSKGSFPSFLGI
jgi:photosystem I subunit PsaN